MHGPSHKPNCLMEMSPNISQVPSLWPASEKAGIAFSYDSFLAKTQLGHGSLKINEVMVEKELYKVQLSLYSGPQDPVTFSPPRATCQGGLSASSGHDRPDIFSVQILVHLEVAYCKFSLFSVLCFFS